MMCDEVVIEVIGGLEPQAEVSRWGCCSGLQYLQAHCRLCL